MTNSYTTSGDLTVERKGVSPLLHIDPWMIEPLIKVPRQSDENRRQMLQQHDDELQLSETTQRQHEEMQEIREWFTSGYHKRTTSRRSR